jgi:hypothetical protein
MRPLRPALFAALLGVVAVVPVRAAPGRIDVVRSDASALELRWTCDRPEIAKVSGDDAEFRRPEVMGGLHFADSGAPDLPTIIQLIGIPEGPLPRLEVVSVATGEMALPDLAPGPTYVRGNGAQAEATETRRRTTFAAAVVPSVWAELEGATWLRGQRVARLAIHPCRYDGSRGELSWARDLVLRVEFATVESRRARATGPDQPDWERFLTARWRTPGRAAWRRRPSTAYRAGCGLTRFRADVDPRADHRDGRLSLTTSRSRTWASIRAASTP